MRSSPARWALFGTALASDAAGHGRSRRAPGSGGAARGHSASTPSGSGMMDMAAVGANPARIIPAWQEFLDDHDDDQPIRGVGEPIWFGRRGVEIAECQLHEALLNLAVEPDRPFWLRCPYDADALPAEIVAAAHHSHPVLVGGRRLSRQQVLRRRRPRRRDVRRAAAGALGQCRQLRLRRDDRERRDQACGNRSRRAWTRQRAPGRPEPTRWARFSTTAFATAAGVERFGCGTIGRRTSARFAMPGTSKTR